MDMSLIAGMPEVIAYIKSQDERIKSLEDENKKLKAELDDVKEDLEWNKHEVVRYSVALEEEYVLKDEYEKLKAETEDLNRRFNDVNYVPFNSNYTDEAINGFLDSIPKRFLSQK